MKTKTFCKCTHSGESHDKTLKYQTSKGVIVLPNACRRANCKCKRLTAK